MAELDDDDLRAELAAFAPAPKAGGRSAREERIIAGFEDIMRFVDEKGRLPRHGEGNDIFERLYAVRLDRLRAQADCREVLKPLDRDNLLGEEGDIPPPDDDINAEELRAQLADGSLDGDISSLKHVRPMEERRAAEEIAHREKCPDFESFKPLFLKVQSELESGERQTRPFELKAEIRPGAWFIVGGLKAYVAEMGETTITPQGRTDARLRVIFDNGTQSSMLLRSLQRALNADQAGRRILDPAPGPLFADTMAPSDQASGMVYVLRSKSDHPLVTANRDLVHKIGVTETPIKQRIAGARLQPTFLMADVEVIATYELFNINRVKLEGLIHRVFETARLEIQIMDRFGRPVVPREWFLVPLHVIDDVMGKIRDGTITDFEYDARQAQLVRSSNKPVAKER
jgi:hypothetical protein